MGVGAGRKHWWRTYCISEKFRAYSLVAEFSKSLRTLIANRKGKLEVTAKSAK